MNDTIRISNTAVALFENGNVDKAIPLFKESLVLSKKALTEPFATSSAVADATTSTAASGNNQTAMDFEYSGGGTPRRNQRVSFSRPYLLPSPANVDGYPSSYHPSGFLHLRTLRIECASCCEQPTSGTDISTTSPGAGGGNDLADEVNVMCTMVPMFNLAVACHARAVARLSEIEERRKQQQKQQQAEYKNLKKIAKVQEELERVVRLYELSYALLMQDDETASSTSSTSAADVTGNETATMFVTLAILNNLGVIHKQLRRAHESHQCFQHLLKFLMYLLECGQIPHFQSMLTPSSHLDTTPPMMQQQQQQRQQHPKSSTTECFALEGFFSNALRELDILRKSVTAPSA